MIPWSSVTRRAGAEDRVGQVLTLINRLRVDNGLEPLRQDVRLSEAAQGHVEEMAGQDFFDHIGPNGADIDARLARVGYAYKVVAENIAAGSSVPEKTVQGWMDSERHRANILLPQARDAGVGYAHVPEDGGKIRYSHYWTLVVAKRREL